MKEELFEVDGFQEVDQFHGKSGCADDGDDTMMQDREEVKAISGTRASEDLKEIDRGIQNVQTSGSDLCSTRGKRTVDQMDNISLPPKSERIQESRLGEDVEVKEVGAIQCEEKQKKKRKRTLMNDKQTTMIERALVDEPHMQRNATLLQSWASKLSLHVSHMHLIMYKFSLLFSICVHNTCLRSSYVVFSRVLRLHLLS